MTKAEIKEGFRRLSPEEQFSVYGELGEELVPATDFRLPPELLETLEGRAAEARANPGSGVEIEEAHARIRESFAK